MPHMEPPAQGALAPAGDGLTTAPLIGDDPSPEFQKQLLDALLAFRRGDFAVRLPQDLLGLDGKIADAFNDIVDASANGGPARPRASLTRSARKASSNSA